MTEPNIGGRRNATNGLASRIHELELDVNALKEENSRIIDENEFLRDKIQQLEYSIVEKEDQCQALEENLDQDKYVSRDLQLKIMALETALQERSVQVEAQSKFEEEYERRVSEVVGSRDVHIKELQTTNAMLMGKVQSLQHEVSNLNRMKGFSIPPELMNLFIDESNNDPTRPGIEVILQILTERERECNDLRIRLDEAQQLIQLQSLDDTKDDVYSQLEDAKEKKSKIEVLEDEIDELKREREDLAVEVLRGKDDCQKMKDRLDRFMDGEGGSHKDIGWWMRRVSEVEEELASCKDLLGEKSQESKQVLSEGIELLHENRMLRQIANVNPDTVLDYSELKLAAEVGAAAAKARCKRLEEEVQELEEERLKLRDKMVSFMEITAHKSVIFHGLTPEQVLHVEEFAANLRHNKVELPEVDRSLEYKRELVKVKEQLSSVQQQAERTLRKHIDDKVNGMMAQAGELAAAQKEVEELKGQNESYQETIRGLLNTQKESNEANANGAERVLDSLAEMHSMIKNIKHGAGGIGASGGGTLMANFDGSSNGSLGLFISDEDASMALQKNKIDDDGVLDSLASNFFIKDASTRAQMLLEQVGDEKRSFALPLPPALLPTPGADGSILAYSFLLRRPISVPRSLIRQGLASIPILYGILVETLEENKRLGLAHDALAVDLLDAEMLQERSAAQLRRIFEDYFNERQRWRDVQDNLQNENKSIQDNLTAAVKECCSLRDRLSVAEVSLSTEVMQKRLTEAVERAASAESRLDDMRRMHFVATEESDTLRKALAFSEVELLQSLSHMQRRVGRLGAFRLRACVLLRAIRSRLKQTLTPVQASELRKKFRQSQIAVSQLKISQARHLRVQPLIENVAKSAVDLETNLNESRDLAAESSLEISTLRSRLARVDIAFQAEHRSVTKLVHLLSIPECRIPSVESLRALIEPLASPRDGCVDASELHGLIIKNIGPKAAQLSIQDWVLFLNLCGSTSTNPKDVLIKGKIRVSVPLVLAKLQLYGFRMKVLDALWHRLYQKAVKQATAKEQSSNKGVNNMNGNNFHNNANYNSNNAIDTTTPTTDVHIPPHAVADTIVDAAFRNSKDQNILNEGSALILAIVAALGEGKLSDPEAAALDSWFRKILAEESKQSLAAVLMSKAKSNKISKSILLNSKNDLEIDEFDTLSLGGSKSLLSDALSGNKDHSKNKHGGTSSSQGITRTALVKHISIAIERISQSNPLLSNGNPISDDHHHLANGSIFVSNATISNDVGESTFSTTYPSSSDNMKIPGMESEVFKAMMQLEALGMERGISLSQALSDSTRSSRTLLRTSFASAAEILAPEMSRGVIEQIYLTIVEKCPKMPSGSPATSDFLIAWNLYVEEHVAASKIQKRVRMRFNWNQETKTKSNHDNLNHGKNYAPSKDFVSRAVETPLQRHANAAVRSGETSRTAFTESFMTRRLNNAERRLRLHNQDSEESERRIRELENELDQLTKELTSDQTRLAEVESKLRTAIPLEEVKADREELLKLRAKTERLDQDVHHYRTLCGVATVQAERLAAVLKRRGEDDMSLRQLIDELHGMSRDKSEIGSLQRRLLATQWDLANARTQAEGLMKNLTDLQNHLGGAEGACCDAFIKFARGLLGEEQDADFDALIGGNQPNSRNKKLNSKGTQDRSEENLSDLRLMESYRSQLAIKSQECANLTRLYKAAQKALDDERKAKENDLKNMVDAVKKLTNPSNISSLSSAGHAIAIPGSGFNTSHENDQLKLMIEGEKMQSQALQDLLDVQRRRGDDLASKVRLLEDSLSREESGANQAEAFNKDLIIRELESKLANSKHEMREAIIRHSNEDEIRLLEQTIRIVRGTDADLLLPLKRSVHDTIKVTCRLLEEDHAEVIHLQEALRRCREELMARQMDLRRAAELNHDMETDLEKEKNENTSLTKKLKEYDLEALRRKSQSVLAKRLAKKEEELEQSKVALKKLLSKLEEDERTKLKEKQLDTVFDELGDDANVLKKLKTQVSTLQEDLSKSTADKENMSKLAEKSKKRYQSEIDGLKRDIARLEGDAAALQTERDRIKRDLLDASHAANKLTAAQKYSNTKKQMAVSIGIQTGGQYTPQSLLLVNSSSSAASSPSKKYSKDDKKQQEDDQDPILAELNSLLSPGKSNPNPLLNNKTSLKSNINNTADVSVLELMVQEGDSNPNRNNPSKTFMPVSTIDSQAYAPNRHNNNYQDVNLLTVNSKVSQFSSSHDKNIHDETIRELSALLDNSTNDKSNVDHGILNDSMKCHAPIEYNQQHTANNNNNNNAKVSLSTQQQQDNNTKKRRFSTPSRNIDATVSRSIESNRREVFDAHAEKISNIEHLHGPVKRDTALAELQKSFSSRLKELEVALQEREEQIYSLRSTSDTHKRNERLMRVEIDELRLFVDQARQSGITLDKMPSSAMSKGNVSVDPTKKNNFDSNPSQFAMELIRAANVRTELFALQEESSILRRRLEVDARAVVERERHKLHQVRNDLATSQRRLKKFELLVDEVFRIKDPHLRANETISIMKDEVDSFKKRMETAESQSRELYDTKMSLEHDNLQLSFDKSSLNTHISRVQGRNKDLEYFIMGIFDIIERSGWLKSSPDALTEIQRHKEILSAIGGPIIQKALGNGDFTGMPDIGAVKTRRERQVESMLEDSQRISQELQVRTSQLENELRTLRSRYQEKEISAVQNLSEITQRMHALQEELQKERLKRANSSLDVSHNLLANSSVSFKNTSARLNPPPLSSSANHAVQDLPPKLLAAPRTSASKDETEAVKSRPSSSAVSRQQPPHTTEANPSSSSNAIPSTMMANDNMNRSQVSSEQRQAGVSRGIGLRRYFQN